MAKNPLASTGARVSSRKAKLGFGRLLLFIASVLASPLLVSCGSPEDVVVWVETPEKAVAGQMFEIATHIRNDSGWTHMLYSIDIGDSYLEGVEIVSATPATEERTHVPIDDTVSHVFHRSIESGKERVFLFRARAGKTGYFGGDFDICIDSDFNCLFRYIEIVIGEKDSGESDAKYRDKVF